MGSLEEEGVQRRAGGLETDFLALDVCFCGHSCSGDLEVVGKALVTAVFRSRREIRRDVTECVAAARKNGERRQTKNDFSSSFPRRPLDGGHSRSTVHRPPQRWTRIELFSPANRSKTERDSLPSRLRIEASKRISKHGHFLQINNSTAVAFLPGRNEGKREKGEKSSVFCPGRENSAPARWRRATSSARFARPRRSLSCTVFCPAQCSSSRLRSESLGRSRRNTSDPALCCRRGCSP